MNVEILASGQLSDEIIAEICRIHRQSLPDDLMPNFGKTVEKKYLIKLNNEENGRIVVASSNNRRIGFILLRFKPICMKKFIDLDACINFILASLIRPKLLVRLALQLIKTRPNPVGSCEIDYFAVEASYRGNGVGAKMIQVSELIAIQNQFSSIYTKTNNYSLYLFYLKTKKAKLINSFSILNNKYYGLVWGVKNEHHENKI